MKKNCIPNVRFPEFKKDGEWKEVCLGECLIQKPEYGLNMPAVPFSPNKPTYLRITDIADDGTFISSNKMSVDAEITSENSLEEGDIVLARTGASVGKAYKFRKEDGPLVFAGFLIRIRLDAKKLNADYLFHYLFSSEYKKWVEAISMRGAQPGINSAEYSSLKIPCPPSVEEQRKIANLLSSVDDLILDSREKQKMLQEQKKGLLQKLFPKDGKKVPEYRFPEFKNDGEWKEVCLGECLVQKPEYGLNMPAVPFSPNKPTYLRITDIADDGTFISSNKMSVDAEITSENSLEEGDIVLARTGASVGKAYKFRKEDGPLVFAGFLIRIRLDAKKLNADYLFHYLFSSEYKKWVEAISMRGAQPGINSAEYSSLKIPCPPSVEEQRKIANLLSSVDDLISVYTDKIDQLTQYKKGLMQQLFA